MVLEAWLDLLCRTLPQVERGALVTGFSAAETAQAVHCWPTADIATTDLVAAATLAAHRDRPVLTLQHAKAEHGMSHAACGDAVEALVLDPPPEPAQLIVALPLRAAEAAGLVLVVHLQAGIAQQAAVMQLMEWGQRWLQLLFAAQAGIRQERPALATQLVRGASRYASLAEAATALATIVATALGSERVALGLVKERRVRVAGLSHYAYFESRALLIQRIEAAMRETLQAQRWLAYPSLERAAQPGPDALALLGSEGRRVLSLPLGEASSPCAILLIEQPADTPWNGEFVERCLEVTALIGPLLALRGRLEQPTHRRWLARWKTLLVRLTGPGNWRLKTILGGSVATLALLALVTGEYRVSAPATLEGRIQRAIIAPYDGYVAESLRRAGEWVETDQVIAVLDDRELLLEQRRWLSQRDELNKQYRKALAERDQAQALIMQAQIEQAAAQLRLLEHQLQQARLTAPFPGVIISGDLSRSLGAPVERGQVLFEVAPLNEYRVALEVDESDLLSVAVGQRGWLSLAAQPAHPLPFVVERVAAVVESSEGAVRYRVEAQLEANQEGEVEQLRPGMQGVGKIAVEQRNYLWIVFHKSWNWLRLKLWSWMP